LPKEAPAHGEEWDEIFRDFENKIMPGITHWQHPRFHAYFPAGNCYPSIIAEMLSAGLGIVGFSWAASPSCTELETTVLEWLGRMINLPKVFLPFHQEYLKPVAPLAPHASLNSHLGTPPTPETALLEDYMYQNGFSSDEEEQAVVKPGGGGVILVQSC
jgi:hypothetical protein